MAAARDLEVLVTATMEITASMRLAFWIKRCSRRVVGELMFEMISIAFSTMTSSFSSSGLFNIEAKNSIDRAS